MKLLGNFTSGGFLDCSEDGVYTVKEEMSLYFKYTRSVEFNYFFIDYSASEDMKGELFYAFDGDVCSHEFTLAKGKSSTLSFYIKGAENGDVGIEPYKLTLSPAGDVEAEVSVDAVAVDLR
jgi:hypothetical protein